MKVHELKPSPGSKKRGKRVARGIAGKGGKTAGRGMKGQRARSKVRVGFEGGQMPLHQRVPKLRGFKNPFRVEYQGTNLDTVETSGLTEVTPESLFELGLVGKKSLVKLLARGEITRALTVRVHACSAPAEAAVIAAGGSVERLPLPFAVRPPARGNALMNR